MPDTAPVLELYAICCRYGQQTVVPSLSLTVEAGELVSLLGPSGCGKTTVLRAIAGFEPIYAGAIRLHGRQVAQPGLQLPPEQRGLGMVFQDYALFPHLTVAQNVAFGLHRWSADQARAAVARLLALVGLEAWTARYPHELSGGQQQRVALARALAPRPALLLLDEPFSNLDVDLRERLSLEVRDLLRHEGTTGLLVTHDQHEAFAVSDRVAVLHQGRLSQMATPYDLYHRPANRFVADFVGQGCFLPGESLDDGRVRTELGELSGPPPRMSDVRGACDVLLRPDDIRIDPAGLHAAELVAKAFKGAETLYTLRLASGATLLSLVPSHQDLAVGAQVRFDVVAEHLIRFPREASSAPTITHH